MTTSHLLRRVLAMALVVPLLAATGARPARADDAPDGYTYHWESYHQWYRGRCGRWHRMLLRRQVRRPIHRTPVVETTRHTPLPPPPARPAKTADTVAPLQPRRDPPPLPPRPEVWVAVSETASSPGLEGFPIFVDATALDADGSPHEGLRMGLEAALLAGGLVLAPSAEAGLHVKALAGARVVRALGAGRTQVQVNGQVEVGIAEGTRPLHVAPLRAESDADSTEAKATRVGLEAIGTEAGKAVVEAVRHHVRSIRVREVHIATDALDIAPGDLAAPLVAGLEAEPHVLAVRHAGAGRGGIVGRGPSARVEVWLAPGFDGSLAEVVRSALLGSESAREVEYEIRSVK